MGTNAMRSAEDWTRVHKWMKRESYIAAARRKLERGSYCQWDHFSWTDYVERQALALTFEKRHLPLSNGKRSWPNKLVRNPIRWSQKKVPSKKSVKKIAVTRSLTTPVKKTCAVKVSSPDVLIFDPKLGKLVVVVSDEEDDGWVSEA